MIIQIQNGQSINTSTDLSSEERHILQKLFAWKSMVASLSQFRQIKEKALKTGWNNSGPVRESRTLSLVIQELENQIRQRLKHQA